MSTVNRQFRIAARPIGMVKESDFAYAEANVPDIAEGQARIRTQMSAALTREQLDRALEAFTAVGKELGVIN